MRTMSQRVWLLALATACGTTPGTADPVKGSGTGVDASSPVIPAGAPTGADAALDGGGCAQLGARCTAWNVRGSCVVDGSGARWAEELCAGGCYLGQCSPDRCSDECALGDVGANGTCRLYDLATKGAIAALPTKNLADRARDYGASLARLALRHGAVLDPMYTDATRTTVASFGGGGDASIWTGTALAAEALRLMATGSPDADVRLREHVTTLHRAFRISGEPGFLARLVLPGANLLPIEVFDCKDSRWHCNVNYEGQAFHFMGDTSRDQYTGAVLGLALAYEATRDEVVRSAVRDDLVTLAFELMKVRAVPVRAELTVGGIPLSVEKTLTVENVILSPSEMVSGKVHLSGDVAGGAGEFRGMREFFPDLRALVEPLTGLPVPIPRAASAMMLGAFFRSALRATSGVANRATEHQQLLSYYQQRAPGWLDTAAKWSLENTGCDDTYYPNHFAFIMAYLWARLEDDAVLGARIRNEVLHERLWDALKDDANVYFAYLWAGARQVAQTDPNVVSASAALATFPAGPRVREPRDVRMNYPAAASCSAPPMSTAALSPGDRPVTDFMWQRSPRVTFDPGDPRVVFPGVDFLVAYWAGRAHGLMADDRPGTCARWMP